MNTNESQLRQYQLAIDTSTIVSRADIYGRITFVNDEFCRISKYSKKELIGQNHHIIRHPDVSPEVYTKIDKMLMEKKIYKGIMKHIAKDGSVFYLNTTMMPILDEENEILEFMAIRHDITDEILLNKKLVATQNELKKLNLSLENEVKSQTQKLINLNRDLQTRVKEEIKKNEEKTQLMFQQSRLASIGEMIGNIAHQWRQPLSELGIDLFKMKQNFANEEKFKQAYEHAKLVIKNMSNTIDDFRTFFNPNKEKDKFHISESVKEAANMLVGSLKKDNIKLNLNIKKDSEIYGFKNELTQVFTNLIANAKDALNSSNIKEKIIQITIIEAQDTAIVAVYNNGAKIDKKIIYKIFEPYFTTKFESHGTGLGLYMSRLIIEKMNGEIYAKNRNTGVEFDIKIPIYKEEL